ncbi:MAG: hypothetical protein KIT84_13500 [Labilithrix sp.]|nr:hypothetical protein [Labilithrix sp.]MCW5812033.1 hypothetical protein [Labilithrix sp.]
MTERFGPDLYAWLAAIAPAERDAAIERELGIDALVSTAPPGEHLVGHHMTGIAALVRALHEIPVRPDDRVLDVGAGLGKVALLTHLFTGAAVRGIEVQRELALRAPSCPGVRIEHGDARTASLEDASVILLYCPFEGPVLEEMSRRFDALEDVVVCALGVDLRCRRLRARPSDSFWSTIWDAGPPRAPLTLAGDARRIALEI